MASFRRAGRACPSVPVRRAASRPDRTAPGRTSAGAWQDFALLRRAAARTRAGSRRSRPLRARRSRVAARTPLVPVRLEGGLGVVTEPVQRKVETARGELLAERRPDAGRAERAEDALAVEAVPLEDEEVLHRDEVALVAADFADLRDLARAVLHALDVHDEIDRGRDLLADGAEREVRAGHEDHRLDARERVARPVRVDRRERPVMSGVHRLEHVERLRPTTLADDDAIRPHPEGVAQQVTDRDLAV